MTLGMNFRSHFVQALYFLHGEPVAMAPWIWEYTNIVIASGGNLQTGEMHAVEIR